ncbi:MAG: fimbria/pilus outer membrane usher protein [Sulfuritalea sp.]|jgi:outer membrane usher protein|nr:fimbria/pilus outer membrane usher protein [Sulfuritalea sp.]
MRPRLPDRRVLLLACAIWACGAAAESQSPPAKSADRILPLEVVVNGTKSGTWLLVERAGALYAPRDAFDDWRVQLDPKAQSIQFKGQDYWSLAAVPGYTSKVDFANQSLALQFSPQAFAETRLTLKMSTKLTVNPALPSVFFNYDLNYQRTDARTAPSVEDLGMLSEIGFSSDLGVLTSSAVGQNLTSNTALGNPRRFLRLETTLTRNLPDQNKTLKLGDTTTRAGMLGSSVYYGGIRFGTNFALAPGFVSQPIPILTGSSVAPSTVDLYVNDVLRQTSNIPTGPFAIDNLPALTGGGEARMVLRDLLGRETVITRSFFTSNKLLATGLDDWSVEAGAVRRDLGIANANYGAAFGRGFWRHGYSDELTLEGLAEVTPKQRKFELGLLSPIAGQWLGSAAFAASSEASLGAGRQWLLGLERSGLHSSIFLQAQGASENFRELGQDKDIKPVKLQLAGNWSYASESFGSFGIGFASMAPFDEARINTMTANYSMRVGERGSLSLTASRSQGAFSGSSLGLSLMLPLDKDRAFSASATSTGKQTDFYLAATQNPTPENSLGWRVLAGQQQSQRHEEGGLNYLGRYGSLSGEVSSSPEQTTLRASGSGGLVLTDGHLFATRHANESFALVEVAGYGDVGAGLGSNMLSRTNSDGIALIPQLVPYQSNSVRLDAKDLPVSAEIDSIEQAVVPAWRSVVKVTFPVRSGRGALLKIRLDDGEVAPAGAIARIEGDKQEFYVARRGEAFVTGLQASNRVVLTWKERQCKFEVALPPETPDEIARLGPFLCKGVTR